MFSDIDSVLSLSKSLTTDLFVIGGAEIYREFQPHIEKWFVTEIPIKVDGADAFMPADYLDGFKDVDSKKLDDQLIVRVYERS